MQTVKVIGLVSCAGVDFTLSPNNPAELDHETARLCVRDGLCRYAEEAPSTPAPVDAETPAPVVAETPAPVVAETPAPVVVETPAPVVSDAPKTQRTRTTRNTKK